MSQTTNEVPTFEKVLWGRRPDAPEWDEQIITTRADQIPAARKWAESKGFVGLRVQTLNVNERPRFGANVIAK